MSIETRIEGPRGCGHRKPGGLYLVTPTLAQRPCGRLPIPLETCPTCHAGVKFSRGFRWVNPYALCVDVACAYDVSTTRSRCETCPLGVVPGKAELRLGERAGLLWIGKQFYATPDAWTREAAEYGVSRRIRALPRGFELGKHWILVAHIEAILSYVDVGETIERADLILHGGSVPVAARPGIFHAFRPTRVEYVTRGDETKAELEKLERRGITPVKVVPTPAWPVEVAP